MRLFVWICGLVASCLLPAMASADVTSSGDLSQREMFTLISLRPSEFSRQWDARRAASEAALPAHADTNARLEIRWQWAAGLLDYAYFHQRETGEAVPGNWEPKRNALAQVYFRDPAAIRSPAYRRFLDAWLHDSAAGRLRTDRDLRTGDNRWLRARFKAIRSAAADPHITAYLMGETLKTHVDDNGARHIESELAIFAAAGGDGADLTALRKALAEEGAPAQDHQALIYKRVDGVDLYAHVFSPERTRRAQPALIWFHGGSWDSGNWRHCPVVCRQMQAMGFVVIQVEYRTSQRFDGTPLDALKDARDLLDWTLRHSARLGINPKRIMTGGFSSGATLGSQMSVLSNDRVHGGAFISGCYDPGEDKWYEQKVSPFQEPASLSPLLKLDPRTPALMLFHARDDEMCPYSDAAALAAKSQAAGANTQLVSFENGGHFFVFKTPEVRDTIKASLKAYADRLGWLAEP